MGTITKSNYVDKSLNQVAAFYRVPAGKITINDELMPTRVSNKISSSGYINIIFQLVKEANLAVGGTPLEIAEIRQWIEYGLIYILRSESTASLSPVLKELNDLLSVRSYLVSHKLSVADIFIFYLLQNTMQNLTSLDKEKYLNVSRWYDNLQENSAIRQSNKLVDFSTLYLASVVPVRH